MDVRACIMCNAKYSMQLPTSLPQDVTEAMIAMFKERGELNLSTLCKFCALDITALDLARCAVSNDWYALRSNECFWITNLNVFCVHVACSEF